MTAATQSRKRRGMATQAAGARWFREHGWPFAESAGAGRPGCDVLGLPGLACEIKARRDFAPLAWIRQAARRRLDHGLPFVLHRPDGMGEASIAEWPVTLRLADFTDLLHAAGYGDAVPVNVPETEPSA